LQRQKTFELLNSGNASGHPAGLASAGADPVSRSAGPARSRWGTGSLSVLGNYPSYHPKNKKDQKKLSGLVLTRTKYHDILLSIKARRSIP